jgi:hypothetical protein
MKSSQLHFFAEKQDLEQILSALEACEEIKYVPTGLFTDPDVNEYSTYKELQNLGVAPHPEAIAGTSYLLVHRDSTVQPVRVLQKSGKEKFAVDQRCNLSGLHLLSGGRRREDVLLYGKISMLDTSDVSKILYEKLAKIIRKIFKRVGEYWVGPIALDALESGARLTIGENSPAEFDLKQE